MSGQQEMRLYIHTADRAGIEGAVSALGLEDAVKELQADGIQVEFGTERTNFIEPVTGTLVIVGGIAAGKFVIRVIREAKGGTVIDMTKNPVQISRNRKLDYGYFVILAKDGSVSVQTKDEPKDALERMITEALSLGGEAPLATLHAAIKGKLSATAKVELKPA
jgi:hypothetical protein